MADGDCCDSFPLRQTGSVASPSDPLSMTGLAEQTQSSHDEAAGHRFGDVPGPARPTDGPGCAVAADGMVPVGATRRGGPGTDACASARNGDVGTAGSRRGADSR